jgi:hypothetical protein
VSAARVAGFAAGLADRIERDGLSGITPADLHVTLRASD